MYRFILSIIISLMSGYQMYAQAQDSIKVYELQPVEFSQKIEKDYWIVQNYFSSSHKLNFTINDAIPIGLGLDWTKANNYGVKLNTGKSNNQVIIKRSSFAISQRDTQQIKSASFYLVIENQSGILKKQIVNVKAITFDAYSATHLKFDDVLLLAHVEFEIEAFSFKSTDKLYFFREDKEELAHASSVVLVDSKKYKTYFINENKLKEFVINFPISDTKTVKKKNLTWQIRITYRTYKEKN